MVSEYPMERCDVKFSPDNASALRSAKNIFPIENILVFSKKTLDKNAGGGGYSIYTLFAIGGKLQQENRTMKHNASRYGLCSLAIASLLLFCSSAFAQDATLHVTPTSGTAPLLVTATNTVILSDPASRWYYGRFDAYSLADGTHLWLVFDLDANSGTAYWYPAPLSAGTWSFYSHDSGVDPTGQFWQLSRGPITVTVNPQTGPPVVPDP